MVVSRRTREAALLILLLGVPLLLLQANFKALPSTNLIDRLVLKVCAPLQAGLTSALFGIHRGWRRYVHLVDVEQQNESLRARNRKLKRALMRLRRVEQRAEELGGLLSFRRSRGFETVGARVVARTGAGPRSFGVRLRIDRDRAEVQVGQPVVTARGVVGRISRTYGQYSEVIPIVDMSSAVDVVVQRSGASGVLRGLGLQREQGCKIDYLLRQADVRPGDRVLTSGRASVFPKGLLVGEVNRVSTAKIGLYKQVLVRPSETIRNLRRALVVVAPAPPQVTGSRPPLPVPAWGWTP